MRALVARIVDRTSDLAASVTNHALAEEGEPNWAERSAVIDYLVGYERRLEGVGHQMPPRPCWTPVIAAMLRHTC